MRPDRRAGGAALAAGVVLSLAAAPARAELWPEALFVALEDAASGTRALHDAAALAAFNRIQPSDAYDRAADWLAQRARDAGLEVEVIDVPADGRTWLGTYRALRAWDGERGTLDVETAAGSRERIADFARVPVSLAPYSASAHLRAELVDVGAGLDDADYAGRDVAGRVVLASGPLPRVHAQAVVRRGAAGIVSSDYIGPPSHAGAGERPDLVGWGQNHPPPPLGRDPAGFAIMIAPRTADRLRGALLAGPLTAVVDVEARTHDGRYRIVTGALRGTRPEAGEMLFTAHLDHAAPSADDDASGCAVNLEAARALTALVAAGVLPAPQRTIRFLWGPEVVGAIAYLTREPGASRRAVAAFHQDMVGASYRRTGAVLDFRRTPDWRPSALDAVVADAVDELQRRTRELSPGGPAPALVGTGGDPDPYFARIGDYERGGDDYVLNDSSFGIPTAHVGEWPYHRIHTDRDAPEFLDATRLGRQAALVVLLASVMGSTDPALHTALAGRVLGHELARLGEAEADGRPERRRLRRERALRALASVEGLAEGAPPVVRAVARARETILSLPPPPELDAGGPVPVRLPAVRGPLRLFFFDWLADRLGNPDWRAGLALRAELGDAFDDAAWTALALVDGRRSTGAIGDAVGASVAPVAHSSLLEYFRLLERAGVLELRSAADAPPADAVP